MQKLLLRSLLFAALLSHAGGAQAINTIRPVGGGNISGIIFDSLSRAPLVGAIVQLIAADNPALLGHSATSDSLGRYSLSDVPPARYAIGFVHPMLDSVGVDVPPREVNVANGQSLRVDLGLPSPARLRNAICGSASVQDSVGVLIGFVHDARDAAPLAGASVTGEWIEYALGRGGLVRTIPRRAATTSESGWFALCNVPNGGTVALRATRGKDSTGHIEVVISREGFARRELYLGATQIVVVADIVKRPDSLSVPPQRIHVGNGRVTGTVIAAIGGKPIANASVRITNGPQAHTNERGEWTIANAPAGTQMLETRAIGFYPVLRHVNVIADALPVRVAMSTMQAVLDTVRITAKGSINEDMIDFAKRRRASGSGRFLTADDIARHKFVETIEVFRLIPGLYVEADSVFMRGAFGRCTPSIYLDGRFMMGVTPTDLGDWVHPKDIAGIEAYPDVPPPQFQEGLTGCGSIVVWRK